MQLDTLSNFANWIMENIFLSWTSGLLNWYNSANYSWSALIIFIIVAIILFEFWTVGLAIAYFGPWAWVFVLWLICWLFYLVAIPAFGGVYFATQIYKPNSRLHKLKTLLMLILFVTGISFFPFGLSLWYLVIFITYLLLFLDLLSPNQNLIFP